MAFSIESRVPYLDQELVDHILSLPDDAIIRDGWSRWILRAALKGTLPEKIRLRRWKVGFTTPEMRWIKARRAAFTSLYQSPSFQARPYWDGDAVVSAFRACCRGEVEESMFFWRAANVELWLREFVRPQRRARGRRRGGGADARRPRRPRASRQHRRGRRRARAGAAGGGRGPAGPRRGRRGRAPARRVPAERGEAPVRRRRRHGLRAPAAQDRPRRPRRRPRRPLPPPGRRARAARRHRRHGREAHRRQPGPQLRARRDPPDAGSRSC